MLRTRTRRQHRDTGTGYDLLRRTRTTRTPYAPWHDHRHTPPPHTDGCIAALAASMLYEVLLPSRLASSLPLRPTRVHGVGEAVECHLRGLTPVSVDSLLDLVAHHPVGFFSAPLLGRQRSRSIPNSYFPGLKCC